MYIEYDVYKKFFDVYGLDASDAIYELVTIALRVAWITGDSPKCVDPNKEYTSVDSLNETYNDSPYDYTDFIRNAI